MNLGEAKNRALKLMREYSINGTIVSTARNADYLLAMNSFADTAQKEIASFKRINAVHEITQNPITNQLGKQGFDTIQHLNDDISYVANGSKSYYFEVDNIADIYIEEDVSGVWTPLTTINNSAKGSYTVYKGAILASGANNDVRVRFSGLYPYNIRNRALYAYNFPTTSDVPDNRPYVRYTMPDDFAALKQVIQECDPRQYVSLTDYRWEGRRTFVVRYDYKGSFRIEYFKQPVTIDDATDDLYEFEIDTEAQELIPYYLGGHAIMDENEMIGTTLLNIYQNKLANLESSDNINAPQVNNTMGW